jgi:hypothetical protein
MCDCIEKYKQDLGLIKKLAKKLSMLIEGDVRIYSKQLLPVPVFDFEPVLVDDHADSEISIIYYEFNQK